MPARKKAEVLASQELVLERRGLNSPDRALEEELGLGPKTIWSWEKYDTFGFNKKWADKREELLEDDVKQRKRIIQKALNVIEERLDHKDPDAADMVYKENQAARKPIGEPDGMNITGTLTLEFSKEELFDRAGQILEEHRRYDSGSE